MSDTFTVSELASMAGISRQRIRQLIETGKGPKCLAVKSGKTTHVRIPAASGLAWLKHRYPERLASYEHLIEALEPPMDEYPVWPIVIKGARQ